MDVILVGDESVWLDRPGQEVCIQVGASDQLAWKEVGEKLLVEVPSLGFTLALSPTSRHQITIVGSFEEVVIDVYGGEVDASQATMGTLYLHRGQSLIKGLPKVAFDETKVVVLKLSQLSVS